MRLKIVKIETGQEITSEDLLMTYAEMDRYCDFEDIGMQGDGAPVVFNKCGDFGYLDSNIYRVDIELSNES